MSPERDLHFSRFPPKPSVHRCRRESGRDGVDVQTPQEPTPLAAQPIEQTATRDDHERANEIQAGVKEDNKWHQPE
jgi:hypothetical protein